jgi:hypothetical protein
MSLKKLQNIRNEWNGYPGGTFKSKKTIRKYVKTTVMELNKIES